MGTYGIGVSRLIAAVVEQSHDEKGCIWTKETAPYFVDVIVSNGKKDVEFDMAELIYQKLTKTYKIDTIFDDRKGKKDTYGSKMADFELIGFPYAVVVGKKLEDGLVEIISRKTEEKAEVPVENLEYLCEIINYVDNKK